MIELLAAIVILGILSTIGVVSVMKYRDSQSKKFDKVQRDLIVQAAKSYYSDNRMRLPAALCTTENVTLEELQNNNYIGEVLDYNKKSYKKESRVEVVKTTDGYDYTPFIEKHDGTVVSYDMSQSDVQKFEAIFTGYTTKETKEKNGKKTDIYYSKDDFVNIALKITPGESGVCSYKYKITGKTAKGKKINQTSKNISLKNETQNGVEIGVDNIIVDYNDFKDGRYTINFMLRDGKGQLTSKSYDLLLDKTNPKCSIDITGTQGLKQGNDIWYVKEEVKLNLSYSDGVLGSGVSKKGLSKNSTINYTNNESDKLTRTQADTTRSGQRWYGFVIDKAGNENQCNKMVKVDTVKPTIKSLKKTVNGSVIDEDDWSKDNIVLDMTAEDQNSGVGTWYYSYDHTEEGNIPEPKDVPNSVWNLYTHNVKGTQITDNYPSNHILTSPYSLERNEKSHIYVCDYAGNCTTKSTQIKIDKTKPKCNISIVNNDDDSKTGENGWYISDIKFKLNKEDPPGDLKEGSGIADSGLSTNKEATYNRSTSNTQSDGVVTWYGYVKDNAGNTNQCSKNLKVDTKAPTIGTINITSQDSRFKSKDVTVNLVVEDANNAKFSISNISYSSVLYNNLTYSKDRTSVPWTISSSYDGLPKKVYITAKDEAGNRATKTSDDYIVYKDCTTPVAAGIYSCGAYTSCNVQCGTGTQYADKTQHMKDAYTNSTCTSVFTPNGCTQSCSVPFTPVRSVGSWSKCTVDCGSGGVRSRLVNTSACENGSIVMKETIEFDETCNSNIDCCSSIWRVCMADCGIGENLAFSNYDDRACPKKDTTCTVTKCDKNKCYVGSTNVNVQVSGIEGLPATVGNGDCPSATYAHWIYCTDSNGKLWTNLKGNTFCKSPQWLCDSLVSQYKVDDSFTYGGTKYTVIKDNSTFWKKTSQSCYVNSGKCSTKKACPHTSLS